MSVTIIVLERLALPIRLPHCTANFRPQINREILDYGAKSPTLRAATGSSARQCAPSRRYGLHPSGLTGKIGMLELQRDHWPEATG